MPLIIQNKFATDLQNAINADDSDQIGQLHLDNPNDGLDANHQSLNRIGDSTPLQYAARHRKLNAIIKLLSLGYEVSEPELCDAVQVFYYNMRAKHALHLIRIDRTIAFLLMGHPTYRPTYRVNDFVGLQHIIDRSFGSGNAVSTDSISVLLTFKIFTSHIPLEQDHQLRLDGTTALPLMLMGNMVFAKNGPYRTVHSADSNGREKIASGSKFAAFLEQHDLLSPSLKQKIRDAGKNVPLHLFSEMIPLEKRFHLAKFLFVDPTPEISEIIATLLTTRSYLNNREDCILLKQCCASLQNIDGIKRYLTEYSDYVVLESPRVWLLLDQILPQGLPKHINSTIPSSIQLFKYAKAWMDGSTQTAELIAAIGQAQDADRQTLLELLFHVVKTLISNEKKPEKINAAIQLLKAFALKLGGDIEWLVYKMLESGLIQQGSLFKKQSTILTECRERCKKDSALIDNSDLDAIFPLINYVLSNVRDKVISGPKKQAIFKSQTKSLGIQFLQWFENYILLNLQKEFSFDSSLIANVYPDFEQKKQSIVAEQKEFAFLGKNDGLFYDPVVIPVQAISLNQDLEEVLPPITYPNVEVILPESTENLAPLPDNEFQQELHRAINADNPKKIIELFTRNADYLDKDRKKTVTWHGFHNNSPIVQAIALGKTSAAKALLQVGFSVTENAMLSMLRFFNTYYELSVEQSKLLKVLLLHPTHLSSKPEIEQCSISFKTTPETWVFRNSQVHETLTRREGFALVFFKFLMTPNTTGFPENMAFALNIFNPIFFVTSATQYRANLVSLLLSSGLIPEDFKNNLLKNNAIHNIPLHAFAPLIPRENIFNWIKAALKDPSDELIALMKPLLISKSYLHNASDRTFLQNCCNHLRSVEKLIPLLTDYSDFCVLDNRKVWLKLGKRLPIGMPSHLDFSDIKRLHIFIFAKWWMAENGNYQHTTQRITDWRNVIKSESLKQIEMELLLFVIMDIRKNNKDTPENYAKAQAAKDILQTYAETIPEVYWIMARLYDSNCLKSSRPLKSQQDYSAEKQKLFDDKSKFGSEKLEQYFPLVNYVLLKNTGPILTTKLNTTFAGAPPGIVFLAWFENFILTNLKPIFNIDEHAIKTVYPNAANEMAQLIEKQKNNSLELGRENGLFYKPLPEVALDTVPVIRQKPATAPPMSVMPSRDSSPSQSRGDSGFTPETDIHAIVAEDLIKKLNAISQCKKNVDDDNPADEVQDVVTEIIEPAVVAADNVDDDNLAEEVQHDVTKIIEPAVVEEVTVTSAADESDISKLEKMSPDNDVEELFPTLASHALEEPQPQRIAIAEGVPDVQKRRSRAEKTVAKAMPFFAAPIETVDEPVAEYTEEIEKFTTTSEKLNFVNATFKQETKNLYHCAQISGYETNELTQQIINRISILSAWKHYLTFRLGQETKVMGPTLS